MNPISAFFVRNIIIVFFFYGLAFFTMGLVLALASRRASELKFARAIIPLAAFGLLHGIHEWIEMFQKIATLTVGYAPTTLQEAVRLVVLLASFLMLLAFGLLLLSPEPVDRRRVLISITGMIGLWALSVLIVTKALQSPPEEVVGLADALARYGLGVPAALLGTWALMTQQRAFHQYGMPQYGRDLVWCATALFLYGAVGQIFVRQTPLVPSTIINSTLFLQWFGVPVQLFRAVMATILAFYMVRALRAFELEDRRRLQEANEAKLKAQTTALEAERRNSREMELLNEELRLTTHELSLLLDLSNLLAEPAGLQDRLHRALDKIVRSLNFPDASIVLLIRPETGTLKVRASTGFSLTDHLEKEESQYIAALDLGEQCIVKSMAMCLHLDGTIIEFLPEEVLEDEQCQRHTSPVTMLSLPLSVQRRIIGSIVLAQTDFSEDKYLLFDEFKLMVAIAQELGLCIENARLYQEAQERETMLADLLHQVVGAQEAERQRIARELHDATGQSLTAIALGLRGVETMLENEQPVAVEQVEELKAFSTSALGELRQIISDLRPSQLDDLGLAAALQWYVQEFERRYAIRTELVVKGDRSRLPSEYETVLFRITQEALTNIAKHANASKAVVKLEKHPAQVSVTIEDDGRGFDLEEAMRSDRRTGWGLLGIQERTWLLGGQYEVDSKPARGTRIRVVVPVKVEAKEDVEHQTVAG